MTLASSCHLSLLLLLAANLTGVCGKRIIGGIEVPPHTLKYQASIVFGIHHICGGTLIYPQWVLTAAHCWVPMGRIRVVLGEHNIDETEDHEQWFNVISITQHHLYSSWTFNNDIMLLKLDRPAIINDWVEQATLPDPNSPPLVNSAPCTVSGWGVTSRSVYILSPVLRSVNVEIFDECWKYYWFGITENMVCAGFRYGGKDACQGDSGGPLVCNGKLEGIVSWGVSCAYAYYPGVYTKVRQYLTWIHDSIS